MANSRKPASTDLPSRVASLLRNTTKPGDRLCLGLSGGLDSVVLLHLLSAARAELGVALSCVHVNHQLSPNANAWQDFCVGVCADLGVPLRIERVQIGSTTRLGLEAAARHARYQAYAHQDVDAIVLAHHLDDQVETVLLRLLRGAGATGLGAMRFERTLQRTGCLATAQPLRILRPLLEFERALLLRYAEARQLRWIEDEANADLRHDRNFLRHEILPRLATRFPAYRVNIGRAARHLAAAAELLDELAAQDLARVQSDQRLSLAALRALTPARAALALRHFLLRATGAAPTSARSEEMLRQLLSAQLDARVRLEWRHLVLHRFQDFVWLEPAAEELPTAARGALAIWRGEERLDLGELGALTFRHSRGRGLSAARLRGGEVSVGLRAGGERLRLAARGRERTLKNLLREAKIAPWQRQRLPLLWCGEQLAWVAGIGADVAFHAAPEEPSVEIFWQAPEFHASKHSP